MSNLDADIASRLEAKDKPEARLPPGIEDNLLQLKGIGQLLGHLSDRGDDDYTHTFYFLGDQVERLVHEIEDLYAAERKGSAASGKKSDPDWRAEWECQRCRQFGQRHATIEARLRDYLLAVKAFHDCGADTDSPIGAPLWERVAAAEKVITEWNSDSDEPAVGIAKLIVSMSGEIHENLGSQFDDAAMVPDAALAGLRWFGLKELYNECYPQDAAQIKKALLEAAADAREEECAS
jgi:hypothetical protein